MGKEWYKDHNLGKGQHVISAYEPSCSHTYRDGVEVAEKVVRSASRNHGIGLGASNVSKTSVVDVPVSWS